MATLTKAANQELQEYKLATLRDIKTNIFIQNQSTLEDLNRKGMFDNKANKFRAKLKSQSEFLKFKRNKIPSLLVKASSRLLSESPMRHRPISQFKEIVSSKLISQNNINKMRKRDGYQQDDDLEAITSSKKIAGQIEKIVSGTMNKTPSPLKINDDGLTAGLQL